VTQHAVKSAAIFVHVILNGTWVLIAYLLHKVGVPLRAIAFVVGIGVIAGNLAAHLGVKLAAKALGRPPS
jgi:hypothetical protein